MMDLLAFVLYDPRKNDIDFNIITNDVDFIAIIESWTPNSPSDDRPPLSAGSLLVKSAC